MNKKKVTWKDIIEIAILWGIFFAVLWIGGEQ